MYPRLSHNIYKRYLITLHLCLKQLKESDLFLINNRQLDINKIFSHQHFNIFSCYILELNRRKILKYDQAKSILLFISENINSIRFQNSFYKYFKKNKSDLIVESNFLKQFVEKNIKVKLSNSNVDEHKKNLIIAVDLIRNYLSEGLSSTLNKECRYINISNSYGYINSLTITKCYNLVFLSLNNPLFLIIEQILHEHTHIKFGKLIEKQKYSQLFKHPFSAYSPFAEKVRPIEYIANGYFSFLTVYNYYHELSNYKKPLLNLFQVERKQYLLKRIRSLKERLCQAQEILEFIFKDSALWKEFKLEFSLNYDISRIEKRNIEFKITDRLNKIQNAEILLGLNTNKISRITIPISETKFISDSLPPNTFLFSNEAYVENKNESLHDFKNLHSSIGSHLHSKDDYTTYVNCYIGKDFKTLIKALKHDENDNSGKHYNIPNCCQKNFKLNWNIVVKKHLGDFMKHILRNENSSETYPWQCNAIAMYFDAGFTWHFPCSLRCSETIKISEKRYRELSRIDIQLANNLRENAKGEYHLLRNNNYVYSSQMRLTSQSIKFSDKVVRTVCFQ